MEANVLKSHGAYENKTLLVTIFHEYISGPPGNATMKKKQKIIDSGAFDWIKNETNDFNFPFLEVARQRCANFFLSMKYKGRERMWSELPEEKFNRSEEVWGPHFFGTDYGACCYFNGDIGMDPFPQGHSHADVSRMWFFGKKVRNYIPYMLLFIHRH